MEQPLFPDPSILQCVGLDAGCMIYVLHKCIPEVERGAEVSPHLAHQAMPRRGVASALRKEEAHSLLKGDSVD